MDHDWRERERGTDRERERERGREGEGERERRRERERERERGRESVSNGLMTGSHVPGGQLCEGWSNCMILMVATTSVPPSDPGVSVIRDSCRVRGSHLTLTHC